jgi:serine/threonine-protein kinase
MAEVRPGDVIAEKYRVERMLGAGGMGYVVAAKHLQLRELVALKFVRQGVLDGDEAVARFIREARASARLKGEHAVRVYDVGTLPSGDPYMVMEYLDGCDLGQLVKRRGTLSVEESADYILQACDALAEAHALGIVHRDVKLANLFLTQGPGGTPLIKVLDFGISKGNPFEMDLGMTTTSAMLGSPRFMSPEQMRDPRGVDARTDVWSLGVILYRLVSGVLPFDADALGMLFSKVMHQPHRALVDARPDLNPAFCAVVDKCLEKEPSQRFANVSELAHALVPFTAAPARAQALADRIAMTLKVPPGTMPLPSSPPRMPSTRPNETGPTAAPWSETRRSVLPVPPAARVPLVIAAVSLASLLLVGGTAMWRAQHTHAQRATPISSMDTGAPPPAATTIVLPAETQEPPPGTTATAAVTAAPQIPVVAATALPVATATAKKGGSATSVKKGVSPAASGSKPEQGIPTTRD